MMCYLYWLFTDEHNCYPLITSPAAYVKNQLNRAIFDTSMKIGTHIEWTMAIGFRNRAIADFARGCHGNRFWVKTHDLHKCCYTINSMRLINSQVVSMERAWNFG